MKDGPAQIVGKTIAAVVLAANKRAPEQQVFLVFSDGTSFEFWGSAFSCCAGLDSAASIIPTIEGSGAKITGMFVDTSSIGQVDAPFTTGRTSAPYVVTLDIGQLEQMRLSA